MSYDDDNARSIMVLALVKKCLNDADSMIFVCSSADILAGSASRSSSRSVSYFSLSFFSCSCSSFNFSSFCRASTNCLFSYGKRGVGAKCLSAKSCKKNKGRNRKKVAGIGINHSIDHRKIKEKSIAQQTSSSMSLALPVSLGPS